ncbi:MAG: phosphate acyltransferase PlsX [Candidatus Brocadiia bacterium]
MQATRIAIDAMGGDFAPEEIVKGSLQFARRNPGVTVILFGEKGPLDDAVARQKGAGLGNIKLVPCGPSVGMGEHPVDALRKKTDSSVVCAVDSVMKGDADAFVSAGNTGVCVAATQLRWRLIPGISRAAIALAFPSETGVTLALDLGANVSCKAEHLLDYGIMGSVYSEHIIGITKPKVALLNVGEEESKGTKLISEARDLLANSGLNFIGFVEGNHILTGKADVVVCEGFVGNVILKTAEGVTDFLLKMIKKNVKRSPIYSLGALLSTGAFRNVREKIDYSSFGGAQLLGVNGVCVISHGRSKSPAMYNALRVADEVVRKRVNENIKAKIGSVRKAAVSTKE